MEPTKEQECCPKFNPAIWHEKIFEWENKKFIKDKVFTLFNIPLNFGSVMKRLTAKVESNSANFVDALCLSDHTSKWNMNLLLAVDKDIPGAENIEISGKFLSKVYEGDFSQTGKWCDDFNNYVGYKDEKLEKMYMWYTTCPKCAKKYGKNYVVIIGKIK